MITGLKVKSVFKYYNERRGLDMIEEDKGKAREVFLENVMLYCMCECE